MSIWYYIGNVSTPMAMIYIGSTLAGCSMLEILKDHIVIEGTLNKLIILPLLTYVLVILASCRSADQGDAYSGMLLSGGRYDFHVGRTGRGKRDNGQ